MERHARAGRRSKYDSPMAPIVVAATGGVGNQLFQFAAARAVASATGRPIEISYRRSDQNPLRRAFVVARRWAMSLAADEDRRFTLARFDRPPDLVRIQRVAAETTRRDDRRRGYSRASLKRAARSGKLAGAVVLRDPDDVSRLLENPLAYAESVVIVAGVLATDRFAAPQIETLRAEISLPIRTAYVRKWTESRRSGLPLVGVHVRRGDYLKKRLVDSIVHLSPEWYAKAAERLTDLHGPLEFVVVSDDPAWCRDRLRFPGPVSIASAEHPEDPLEDLALLSQCDHHIIANSTFSWWGARLASGEGSAVAPTLWWIDPPIGREVLPECWIELANSREGAPLDRAPGPAVV